MGDVTVLGSISGESEAASSYDQGITPARHEPQVQRFRRGTLSCYNK